MESNASLRFATLFYFPMMNVVYMAKLRQCVSLSR